MIYDKKYFFLKKYKLYVVRLEPTISTLTAIRSIRMAKRDSDGYRSRKNFCLKSILFIMFANLKLVLRSYTSLYDKENKHSLHVGALYCEQMSSVTWKDVVDLDEIYLRNACKSPVPVTQFT